MPRFLLAAAGSLLALHAMPSFAAPPDLDVLLPAHSGTSDHATLRREPPKLPDDVKVLSAQATVPGERPFLHDVVADLDLGYSGSGANGDALKDDRSTHFGTVGLRFGMGDKGMGSIAVTHSNTTVDANDSGGFATHSDVGGNAVALGAGYWVRPELALGIVASHNDGSGSLAYPPADGNATDTRGTQYGPYLTYRLPFAPPLGLTVTSAFLIAHGQQRFTNNFPDHEDSDSRTWVNTLAGTYPIGRFTLRGALSWTHVASQHTGDPAFLFGPAPPPPDRDWATVSAGIGYWLTPQWEVRLNAATWVGTSQTGFHQVSFGLSHAF